MKQPAVSKSRLVLGDYDEFDHPLLIFLYHQQDLEDMLGMDTESVGGLG